MWGSADSRNGEKGIIFCSVRPSWLANDSDERQLEETFVGRGEYTARWWIESENLGRRDLYQSLIKASMQMYMSKLQSQSGRTDWQNG